LYWIIFKYLYTEFCCFKLLSQDDPLYLKYIRIRLYNCRPSLIYNNIDGTILDKKSMYTYISFPFTRWSFISKIYKNKISQYSSMNYNVRRQLYNLIRIYFRYKGSSCDRKRSTGSKVTIVSTIMSCNGLVYYLIFN
jgi:hypothetical protein